MHNNASEAIKRRLRIAARRLGAADPLPCIGPALDRAFPLPQDDPRYGNNALLPGSIPLETSFSELNPGGLRFDMELGGPGASPQQRRDETTWVVRNLVGQDFGGDALRWFDQRSEAWRGRVSEGHRFGAFFGAGFDEHGLHQAKAYYEMSHDQLEALAPNLQHAVRTAMSMLPGLTPLFTSLGCGRQRGSQRVYLFHPNELRLLDLEPLMHRLGIGHQLPSLLTALGIITGGRFVLPEGSVVLGLKDTPRGTELKLDLLLPAFPDPPQQMHGLIQMHMADRPDAQRALRNWIQAFTPDESETPGEMSVVGAKVDPQMPARLSVYLRPNEARPRRHRPVAHRHTEPDPYAYESRIV